MRISVVGLGYVGLPLAALLSRNYSVIGFDVDSKKVELVHAGKEIINEPRLKPMLDSALRSGKLKLTSDPTVLIKTDVKIITVGTPFDSLNSVVDYSQLDSSLELLHEFLKLGDVIILKSTVPPGTTTQHVKAIIESHGFNVPEEIGLVFSPERMIEGQAIEDFESLPKIIGATDERSYSIASEIIGSLGGKVIRVSSPEAAEMVKMIDNYSRFVFLGLTNEIALMCEKIGVDVNEVISSAKIDYPRNAGLLRPGPGVGGSCLNKDPFILRSQMLSLDLDLHMVSSAREVNSLMPKHVADMVNKFSGPRRKVLIAGIAFKGDTDDTRFTPAFQIIEELESNNFDIVLSDPFVKSDNHKILRSVYDAASDCDVIVILTDHTSYKELDLKRLKEKMSASPLMIDTRTAISRIDAEENGFEYHGLGNL